MTIQALFSHPVICVCVAIIITPEVRLFQSYFFLLQSVSLRLEGRF